MAYLSIQGITVPVSVEGVSLDYDTVGSDGERSPTGSLEGGPLAKKREWNMSTTPVPASEVDAWVGLIEGKGRHWSFDSTTYSDGGRGISSGSATIQAGAAKLGAAGCRISAGTSSTWAVQLGSSWTTLHWAKETGVWGHYVSRNGGVRFFNGLRDDTYDGGLTVSGGSLTLSGGAFLDDFDDLVAMPYAVPDAWAPLLYAKHASAWDALPRVTASGSFAASSVTVRGRVTGTRVIRCAINGTFQSAHVLKFTLREV